MVDMTAPSKEEIETDLQLSYITGKNNSLIEQITSQLQELDNISILVDEKRAVFRHEQRLSAAQPENSGVNLSRNAEYLQNVLERAIRQDEDNPQMDEATIVPDESKPFATPLSHAQLIIIARKAMALNLHNRPPPLAPRKPPPFVPPPRPPPRSASSANRLERPPYVVKFENQSLGIALRSTPGGELPMVTKSNGALPLKGDVVTSVNDVSLLGYEDPFEEVMRRVKTLKRPIHLGFKPHPNPEKAFASSMKGVLSSTKSPPVAPRLVNRSQVVNTPPANKFDPANEPKATIEATAPPLLPPAEAPVSASKQPPRKPSTWNKLRGVVTASNKMKPENSGTSARSPAVAEGGRGLAGPMAPAAAPLKSPAPPPRPPQPPGRPPAGPRAPAPAGGSSPRPSPLQGVGPPGSGASPLPHAPPRPIPGARGPPMGPPPGSLRGPSMGPPPGAPRGPPMGPPGARGPPRGSPRGPPGGPGAPRGPPPTAPVGVAPRGAPRAPAHPPSGS